MLAERILTKVVSSLAKQELCLKPTIETMLPEAKPGQKYMLYMHVPFCQRLCPYCSFNRYVFREDIARRYFESLRKEMLMLVELGYDIESIYMGGGTPTVLIDELCDTLDLARELWDIREVGSECNPNHLTLPYLEKLQGRVQRLSVGVQSFNNTLLKQMDRYEKYGSGEQILKRIQQAVPYFDSLNVDMIFNFPSQSEEILFDDLEKIVMCGARQTTFSPLYVSNKTMKKMASTLGKMDYGREFKFYRILDEVLAGGKNALFERSTLWTFTRRNWNLPENEHSKHNKQSIMEKTPRIEEYQTFYDEYPAIGSGSITHLQGNLYVNTFSLEDYNSSINKGRMSLMGKSTMSRRDLMRYCFLINLYKMRLDKRHFKKVFGCSIEAGLPIELAFMRTNRAFAVDNKEELTLTLRGRYLVLVMYRQFLSGMNNLRDQARAALSGRERELLFGGEEV